MEARTDYIIEWDEKCNAILPSQLFHYRGQSQREEGPRFVCKQLNGGKKIETLRFNDRKLNQPGFSKIMPASVSN